MQTLLRTGYWIFVAAVVGVGLLLLASLVPVPGNFEVKIVQSGSMEPAIKTGSIVVTKPVSSYKVDDVITFGEDTREEIPTTHRIIGERVENGVVLYRTQGDANEDPDPQEVRENEIIGKVLFSIPFAGFILDFARQPLGFVLMVGIPAGLVILDEVGTIWREVKAMRSKKKEEKREEITHNEEDDTA